MSLTSNGSSPLIYPAPVHLRRGLLGFGFGCPRVRHVLSVRHQATQLRIWQFPPAAELAELFDALGIDRAHLFCHSTGCGIGLSLSAACPDRVAGLVLVNPWSHGDAHLTAMQRLRVAAARALDPYCYAGFNASLLFPPDYRRAHAKAFEKLARNAAPQDADRIEDRLEAILAFDARPLAPGLTCPTLVTTAADDQLMPSWFGAELAALIPGAAHCALDGGGHMLPETRGDALANAVTDFLDTVA